MIDFLIEMLLFTCVYQVIFIFFYIIFCYTDGLIGDKDVFMDFPG